MPSMVLGNPVSSGAHTVISGAVYSGRNLPVGGVQLTWLSSGGNCYIAFSGGGPVLSGGFMTVNSGGMLLSGGGASGMLDGIPITPAGSYFVPAIAFNTRGVASGTWNLFAVCDPAASGVGRLYWEVM
jgi:hypothetical protein